MVEKVSIIIPVFNAGTYLSHCLDSVQKQTYKELEVLLIDDGSIDNSQEICLAYTNKNPIFTYYRQENCGVSVARNKGMELAAGSWICFIDSDDYVESDMIESLWSHIDKNTDVVCCGCMTEVDHKSIKNSFFESDMIFRENKRELFMQLLDNNYHAVEYRYTAIGVPWGKLYRKSFLQHNKISFDKNLRRMQDNIFNMDVFRYARQIKYINYLGYHYVAEHVGKFADSYDKDAAKYLSKVIDVQKNKLVGMHLLEDEEIFNCLVWEAVKIYILAVQKSYYVCNDMSYWEKCNKAKMLLYSEPFASLFFKPHTVRRVQVLKLLVRANLLIVIIEGKRIWKKL